MKRTFKTLAVFLSAIILLTGCSNDDDELIKETKIESVNNGQEVKAFFNSEWADYNAADSYPETFFNRELMDKENICLVNSKEEFKNIYFGNKEIPEIDFSKYSLIIGKKQKYVEIGKKSPASLKDIKLYDTEAGYQLNLYCTSYIPEGDMFTRRFFYFWGLFPKLNNKIITTQIRLE